MVPLAWPTNRGSDGGFIAVVMEEEASGERALRAGAFVVLRPVAVPHGGAAAHEGGLQRGGQVAGRRGGHQSRGRHHPVSDSTAPCSAQRGAARRSYQLAAQPGPAWLLNKQANQSTLV